MHRFVPLLVLAAATHTFSGSTPAKAGDVSQDKHGTWTISGSCSDKIRLVISSRRISIFKNDGEQPLIDADEAVWNGATLINASRPGIGDADPVIALTARVVVEDGASKLMIERSEPHLSGQFQKCSDMAMPAAKTSPKKAQAKPIRAAHRKPVGPTSRPGAIASLGGLF